MRLRTFLLSVLGAGLLSSQAAQAQYHPPVRHYDSQGRPYLRGPLHVTLAAGTALYNGDLGNKPANNFLGLAMSGGVMYRMSPRLHLGGELSYFKMGARDQSVERNLAFTSTNGIGTVLLRFDLLRDESILVSSLGSPPPFQLYLQTGAGLLLYGPKAYNGTARATSDTNFLAPERNNYPAVAVVAPVGAGFSVRVVDRLRAGIEGNYYFTSTDQLDDANARLGGASRNRDGFGTVMLKLDYSLK